MSFFSSWKGHQLTLLPRSQVDRLNSQGQRVIPVDVRNCSVIKTDSGNWLNRIEANTSFDFEKVGLFGFFHFEYIICHQ